MLGSPQIILQYWATKLLTLASFIKQSTQQRGEGRAKKENPKSKPKAQKPKVGRKGQRNKLCSKAPPTNHKKHIKEGNEKFERVGSIEEPSLATGNAPQNRNERVLRLKFSC